MLSVVNEKFVRKSEQKTIYSKINFNLEVKHTIAKRWANKFREVRSFCAKGMVFVQKIRPLYKFTRKIICPPRN
jgi:hypothetical protein